MHPQFPPKFEGKQCNSPKNMVYFRYFSFYFYLDSALYYIWNALYEDIEGENGMIFPFPTEYASIKSISFREKLILGLSQALNSCDSNLYKPEAWSVVRPGIQWTMPVLWCQTEPHLRFLRLLEKSPNLICFILKELLSPRGFMKNRLLEMGLTRSNA